MARSDTLVGMPAAVKAAAMRPLAAEAPMIRSPRPLCRTRAGPAISVAT